MDLLTRNQSLALAALKQPAAAREQGLFIAEGYKVISELMASQLQIESIIIRSEANLPEKIKPGITLLEAKRVDFDRITSLVNAPGVLAVVRRPRADAPPIPQPNQWFLVLDHIMDPGNMGTIIRTAEWFGFSRIICSVGCADPFSSKVVQSAMGSLFRLTVHTTVLPDYLHQLREHQVPVFAAVLEGQDPGSLTAPDRGVLIIGSEAHGIEPDLLKLADHRLAIPKAQGALTESLNAAVAAGILMHQLVKK